MCVPRASACAYITHFVIGAASVRARLCRDSALMHEKYEVHLSIEPIYLPVTFFVFQLAVVSARSFTTPGRSRERSQYLPHRCSSRPPKKRAPIFLPRRLCWFTWRPPCPPARSRCRCLESECDRRRCDVKALPCCK